MQSVCQPCAYWVDAACTPTVAICRSVYAVAASAHVHTAARIECTTTHITRRLQAVPHRRHHVEPTTLPTPPSSCHPPHIVHSTVSHIVLPHLTLTSLASSYQPTNQLPLVHRVTPTLRPNHSHSPCCRRRVLQVGLLGCACIGRSPLCAMGCSSSKAAMGEVPAGQKGPSQADMVKANSPAQTQSPAVAPAIPTLSAAKPAQPAAVIPDASAPSVAPATTTGTTTGTAAAPVGSGVVVPIYPVLSSDLVRPTTAQPSRTDSLAHSGSTSPSGMAPTAHPSSIHASLPAPLSPSTLSAISRSLPAPLPPVKPGIRPALILPVGSGSGAASPRLLQGLAGPSSLEMNGSQLVGERAAGWKSASQPVSASATSSDPNSAKDSLVPSRQSSFSSLLAVAVPSLNLSDPAAITTKMTDTFLHYSRRRYETGKGIRQSASSNGAASTAVVAADESHKERVKDEEAIDKKALGQLATDCVLSLLLAIRADIALRVKDQKGREKKEKEMRKVYLPGSTLEESVEISRYYLQNELQYKHGCITRTMFFYHFARCYKSMFQFEKLTVEREQLVDRWTTLGQQKLEEKKKRKIKEKKEREKGDKSDRESSVSKSHRETRGRSKDHKRNKSRQTAPANSISDLMQSTSSKVMQADRKLTGTLSATKAKELTTVLTKKARGDEVIDL